MPTVRFAWSPELVAIRREACPAARWLARERAWVMSPDDAAAFLAASHARLAFTMGHDEITIDGERWVIGFVRGAPYRQSA
jgi:hypothetical protein